MPSKVTIRKNIKRHPESPKLKRLRIKLNRISDKAAKQQLPQVAKSGKALIRRTAKKVRVAGHPTGQIATNANGNLRGMHNSGKSEHMQKIRAMRKFYGPMMPVMKCDTCTISANCPQFKAGYECAFTPFLKSHGIKDEEDLVQYMKDLLGANLNRIHLALIMERVTGERPGIDLSEQLNSTFDQLARLTQMERDKDTTEIEFETDDNTIIGSLFGNLHELKSNTATALDADFGTNLRLDDEEEDIIDVESSNTQSRLDLIREYKQDNN